MGNESIVSFKEDPYVGWPGMAYWHLGSGWRSHQHWQLGWHWCSCLQREWERWLWWGIPMAPQIQMHLMPRWRHVLMYSAVLPAITHISNETPHCKNIPTAFRLQSMQKCLLFIDTPWSIYNELVTLVIRSIATWFQSGKEWESLKVTSKKGPCHIITMGHNLMPYHLQGSNKQYSPLSHCLSHMQGLPSTLV